MNTVLTDLGFTQDVGCRHDEWRGCFYYGFVLTFAFDQEGNGYSKLGRFDLASFGFQLVKQESLFASVSPAAA